MRAFSHFSAYKLGLLAGFALLMVGAQAGLTSARAEGSFISAPNRIDVAYDGTRGLLYISSGNQVLRYQLSTASFLSPITLGGTLMGMDISPDGSTLAVADESFSKSNNWVHLVNLDTLADNKVQFTLESLEGGTFTVAYDRSGQLFVTSEFEGSGWVPLRRYDPVNNTTAVVASVRQDSMLRSTPKGTVVAIEESNISSGPFGRYDIKQGNLAEADTDWFTFEVASNKKGTLYAAPTYGGTFIADKNMNLVGQPIGTYAGPQPIGAVFHPEKALVYFPWAQTSEVKVYSTKTWQEVDSFDFENAFDHTGNAAFVAGRAKMSADGSLLFVTVDGGVRYVETRHHKTKK